MNRNFTALILLALSAGIYFTFTRGQLTEAKAVKVVNDQYTSALEGAVELIKVRDEVLAQYNQISETDRERLDKMIPSSVDNIRLIIDLNDIARKHGFSLRNIKAETSPSASTPTTSTNPGSASSVGAGAAPPINNLSNPVLDTVTVKFSVTAPYLQFVSFLQDIESNLRIMDVTKLTLTSQETGIYDFSVELKTYWLRH